MREGDKLDFTQRIFIMSQHHIILLRKELELLS